nr:exonuclease domain-containing protein [Micromonospora sp. DSM 115978]
MTFVVVDLETTGVSPSEDAITEIGAVKVRGGEVVAEMATLVNPGRSIPPMITVLTGLTDRMVAAAPPVEQVVPTILEFSKGAVLVAHNAGFDLGFLRAAAERAGYPVPKWEHLDTVRLARQVVTK